MYGESATSGRQLIFNIFLLFWSTLLGLICVYIICAGGKTTHIASLMKDTVRSIMCYVAIWTSSEWLGCGLASVSKPSPSYFLSFHKTHAVSPFGQLSSMQHLYFSYYYFKQEARQLFGPGKTPRHSTWKSLQTSMSLVKWSNVKPWPSCSTLFRPNPFYALLCSIQLHFTAK